MAMVMMAMPCRGLIMAKNMAIKSMIPYHVIVTHSPNRLSVASIGNFLPALFVNQSV